MANGERDLGPVGAGTGRAVVQDPELNKQVAELGKSAKLDSMLRMKGMLERKVELERQVAAEKELSAGGSIVAGGVPQEQLETQKMLQKAGLKGKALATAEYVVSPLMEIGRGFQLGGERLFGDLDAVAELIGKSTGLERGGLFEDFAKSMGNEAQNIPETRLNPAEKLGFNLVGGFVPLTAELGLIKTSDITKFAIMGAIDEYKNDPDRKLTSLVTGGAKGAATSMTFQAAGSALKLMQHGSVKASEAFLTWVTNSRRAAKRLMSNGGKNLNLNPFGKPKSSLEIKEENMRTKTAADDKAKTDLFSFRESQKVKTLELTQSLRDSEQRLAANSADMKNNLKTKSGFKIEEAARKSTKAIGDMNNAIKNKAVNVYDAALQRFGMAKRQAGVAVENAVNAAVNSNPGASVPYKLVNNTLTKTVREFSPFEIKKGKVLPRTGATKTEDTSMFQRIIDDFKGKKAEGGLNVKYLQDLKKDLNNLSTKYYKSGDSQLGKMYDEMSKTVNPANIVSKNKQLQKSFSEIHEANIKYADLVPKYDAAMKFYFRKDASGNYIPDPNKAFNAIASGDRALIREMEKADKLLPKADRILPKIRELDSMMNRNLAHQKGIVSSLKRQTQKDMVKLQQAKGESMRRLKAQGRRMTSDERARAAREIRTFSDAQTEEQRQLTNILNEKLKFYQDQDALRSFAASKRTGAGLLQSVLGFGSLGVVSALKGEGVALSTPALAGVAALSPIGVANAARLTTGTTGAIDKIIGGSLRNRTTQQVAVSEIIRRSSTGQQPADLE